MPTSDPSRSSSISPLTRQIANAIGDFCAAKAQQPQDVRQVDFFKWLKDEKRLGQVEIGKVRGHLQLVGGFDRIRNAFFVTAPTATSIEKEELKGIAKLGKANVVALGNDEMFLQRFREVMSGVGSMLKNAPVPTLARQPRGKEKTARVLHLALSDLHFGSKLDPRELPYRYDFEEEARALASVIVRTCEFKTDKREETELVIWLGGDLIRGKIHDREAGRALAEQIADAQCLLIQAVRIAAHHFKRVRVYCVGGNHDRDEARHPDSDFEEGWDSRATYIYTALKYAVEYLSNVEVHIPRTPFAEWEALGHQVYATHGHRDFNTGNSAKGISISGLVAQMNAINLAQAQRKLPTYRMFLTGHTHQGLHLPLAATDLVINPPLIPVDGYARGIGYPMTRSAQTLIETTERYPVGDLRFLDVPPEVLQDKALDKVIRPFRDF